MSSIKHASINEVVKKTNSLRTELVDKINAKADSATTYDKDEVDSKFSSKADLVDGVVPASQLPSYVDDVLEYASLSVFPSTGESGKIYVATDTNLTYRWGGSQYVEISQSIALGETASTAYAGDKGKKATDDLAAHKEDTENPHAVTAAQVGAYTRAQVDEKATSAAKAVGEVYRKKTDLAVYDDTSTGGKYLYFEFEGGEQIRLYKWDESTAQSLYNEAYGYMSEASESLGGKQMVVWWLKENYADIDTEPDVYANVELMTDGDISGATIIGISVLIPSTSIRTFTDGTKGKFLVLEKADTLAKKSEVDAVSAKANAAQESADAVASDLTTHTSDTNIHITEKEREIWNCVKVFDSIVAQAYVPLFKTEGDGTTGLMIKPNVRATLYWDVASLQAKYLYSDEGLQVGSASLKSTLTPSSLNVNIGGVTTWITLFAESGKTQLYMLKRAILTLGAENEDEGAASYITSGSGKTTFALKDGTKGSVITPDGSAVVTENTLKTKAPVTSVNGSTGAVTLKATDLGALPATQMGIQYTVASDVEFAGGVYVNGGLYKRGASDDPYLPKTELDSTYATKSALEALAATVGEANDLLESVA